MQRCANSFSKLYTFIKITDYFLNNVVHENEYLDALKLGAEVRFGVKY